MMERKEFMQRTLSKVLALPTTDKLALWNMFAKESGVVGEDSYLFNLANSNDVKSLCDVITIVTLTDLLHKAYSLGGKPFVMITYEGEISACDEDGLNNLLRFYWDEIVEEIAQCTDAYIKAHCDVVLTIFQEAVNDVLGDNES